MVPVPINVCQYSDEDQDYQKNRSDILFLIIGVFLMPTWRIIHAAGFSAVTSDSFSIIHPPSTAIGEGFCLFWVESTGFSLYDGSMFVLLVTA